MATYLPGVTDTVPQITPFQPDLGMLQRTLGTLQNRYDQGFAGVSNAYHQVLQAPLSDGANRAVRNTFLDRAEQQLKNLSAADLSLPENQQAAEQVFSPFWEDELMLQDATLTKWYNGELQKALSTRDSSDEKVRSGYSDVAARYLQNGLDQLQQAGRDPQRYGRLEKRRFVPFKNMEAYLNEQAKEAGLKIEWNTTEGPYLVNTTNGSKSTTAFETFAHNMLGNNFTEQFRVMGVVEKEERLRQIKELFPLLSDRQALEIMGKEVVKELKSGIDLRRKAINKHRTGVQSGIAQYEQLSVLSPVQERAYQALLQQEQDLEDQLKGIQDESSELTASQQQLLERVAGQPDHYFSQVMKQRVVRGWSEARAANQQTSATINPVWKENNDIHYKERTLELEERKYLLDKWKAENEAVNDKKKNTTSRTTKTQADTNPATAGKFDGLGTTDVTKVPQAYQVFQERQQQRWDFAHQQIFDIHSGVGSVLSTLGVKDSDAVKYMDMMRVLSTQPGIKGKYGAEDMKFFRSIGATLKTATGIDAGSGFFNARSALLEASRKRLENQLKEGGAGLTGDDLDAMISYVSATWSLQEHDSMEAERKRLVQERITKDPTTFGKILTQKNDQYEISSVDDVVKDFKPLGITNLESGDTMTLNPRQFADLYLQGKFEYLTMGQATIDGKLYNISQFDGQEGNNAVRRFSDFYYDRADDLARPKNPNSLQAKYGTSQEQRSLRDKLNTEVVPYLPEYQNQSGKYGYIVRYDLSDKTTGDVGARLINEVALASNREGIYVDGHLSDQSDVNRAVEQLSKMGEDELEKYVSTSLLKTVGVNGRPSLEVVFKPIKSTDKTVIGELDLTALSEKRVEFDLNPQASGETLRQLRFNSGHYIYGALLRGIPLQSDQMLEAAGFSFEVTPDRQNDPRRALVRIHSKEFKDGKYVNLPDVKDDFSFDQQNPDEIMHFLYGLFRQHLVKNLTLQTQYQAQQPQLKQLRTPQQIRDDFRAGNGLPAPTR